MELKKENEEINSTFILNLVKRSKQNGKKNGNDQRGANKNDTFRRALIVETKDEFDAYKEKHHTDENGIEKEIAYVHEQNTIDNTKLE